MSILEGLVRWTERIEGMNGIHDALTRLLDADGAIETAAAASQLAAELAITTAATATVRTSMSLLRLELAISGQIWKWEAVSYASGAISGLTAGAIIDDTLDGGDGDDVLNAEVWGSGKAYIGGRGNDTINGAYYSDSYVFNLGDGQDTVNDNSNGYANTDVLRFGVGIAAADLVRRRQWSLPNRAGEVRRQHRLDPHALTLTH
jgi:hypothetical protein